MSLIDLNRLAPSLFPTAEDDEFEFKSSLAIHPQINEKLNCAVSGFANSGGGCFIWGVDKTGNADGGVETKIGKQDLRDWMDQVIHRVAPAPRYEIKFYDDADGRGALDTGKLIVAVSIHPSAIVPHMAADNKYYIRAGAHTVAAGHFLVEALWARRQVTTPILTPTLKPRFTKKYWVVDLAIVNLTNSPAVDIVLDIEPKLGSVEDRQQFFPVRLPMIDQANPFLMYLDDIFSINSTLTDEVVVTINYKDIAGNHYQRRNEAPLIESLPPNVREFAH